MRFSTHANLVAASIMAISSSVYAADRGGNAGGNNNENGCAIGNATPATCPTQFAK